MKRLLRALCVLVASCAGPGAKSPHARSDQVGCEYHVKVVQNDPMLLEVDAHCTGRDLGAFIASEAVIATHVTDVRTASGEALARHGNRFELESETSDATLHYRIDLDAIAKQSDSMDIALRQGRSLIAPVSTWLIRPDPMYADLRVKVRMELPKDTRFTTGLERHTDGFRLFAHEIPVATYAVFGSFASKRVSVAGRGGGSGKSAPPTSNLEIVLVDGNIETTDDALFQWVRDSAAEVAKFWHGFPVPHALVILLPVADRQGVVFGKVLPESSPAAIVMVGEQTSRTRLYGDWVLVHELFHLGVPSFNREGKWFDEGLATYYESLIRARAGWLTEEQVWKEFVEEMPQGLRAMTHTGLEHPADSPDIYWGGALFCMVADVELRNQSQGERGLEDGLLRVLNAGGHASEVWSLTKTLRFVDEAVGGNSVRSLAARHSERGSKVDLDALFAALGVEALANGVKLHEDAPLSAIRKSLVFGK